MPMIHAPGWERATGTVIVPGAVAGDVTIPGGPITAADALLNVTHLTADLVTRADLTSEFTITGAKLINNAAGTSSAGAFLLVVWAQKNA